MELCGVLPASLHLSLHAAHAVQKRIAFLMHGVHHAQPRVKTRLVMPPLVSVPLACFFYALFTLVVSMLFRAPDLTGALFAGFVVGYVCYDLLHYSLHHVQFKNGFMKALRSHHMRHHTEYDSRFGVSTPLWDHVFQTEPRKDAPRREELPARTADLLFHCRSRASTCSHRFIDSPCSAWFSWWRLQAPSCAPRRSRPREGPSSPRSPGGCPPGPPAPA